MNQNIVKTYYLLIQFFECITLYLINTVYIIRREEVFLYKIYFTLTVCMIIIPHKELTKNMLLYNTCLLLIQYLVIIQIVNYGNFTLCVLFTLIQILKTYISIIIIKNDIGNYGNPLEKIIVFEKECSICLDKIDNQESYILKCSHYFHVDCLTKWMNIDIEVDNHKKCPMCRTII